MSFKQITNSIEHLITSLEIHHLQNKYICEVKRTEQDGLESTLTWENPKKWMGPVVTAKLNYFEYNWAYILNPF